MRPVDKGTSPVETFAQYGDAKLYLLTRLGNYCSYCELHIALNAHIAVEHIQAKAYKPDLEREWDNFLVSCTMCNSMKSSKDGRPPRGNKPARDFDKTLYLWPHEDNTWAAFIYREDGKVVPNPSLASDKLDSARRTCCLFELNRLGNLDTDNRFQLRKNVNRQARRYLLKYEEAIGNGSEVGYLQENIFELAKSAGFWSVWMTVFANHRDVCKKLSQGFQGTKTEYFNEYLDGPSGAD